MDALIITCIVVVAVCIFIYTRTAPRLVARKVHRSNTYLYAAKPLSMSPTEARFFKRLESVAGDRYYVFPQVHLSALLDHHVKGQNWRYAFRHINGKSVDYVLCDRESLRPIYAIELDDATHQRPDRQARDREVERMFAVAGMPLVRFNDKDASPETIVHALMDAYGVHTARR